jgi:hypothetical protein
MLEGLDVLFKLDLPKKSSSRFKKLEYFPEAIKKS